MTILIRCLEFDLKEISIFNILSFKVKRRFQTKFQVNSSFDSEDFNEEYLKFISGKQPKKKLNVAIFYR